MDPRSEKIFKAADYIKERLDGRVPVAGIVLGSGLGKLAEKIENPIVIHYKDIPGFPVSTAISTPATLPTIKSGEVEIKTKKLQ